MIDDKQWVAVFDYECCDKSKVGVVKMLRENGFKAIGGQSPWVGNKSVWIELSQRSGLVRDSAVRKALTLLKDHYFLDSDTNIDEHIREINDNIKRGVAV